MGEAVAGTGKRTEEGKQITEGGFSLVFNTITLHFRIFLKCFDIFYTIKYVY